VSPREEYKCSRDRGDLIFRTGHRERVESQGVLRAEGAGRMFWGSARLLINEVAFEIKRYRFFHELWETGHFCCNYRGR
jgi:hypothetical protein